MTDAPPVRNRLIGSALRRYREACGYSLADVTGHMKGGPSKLSRIETGERGILPQELRELLAGYGVDEAMQDVLAAIASPRRTGGWWARYRSLLAGDHLDFLAAESTAGAIFTYAPVQLPALVHSTGYARAVAAADPGAGQGAVDEIVQATYARQQAVLRGQDTRLTVILGEAALRQQAGGTAVMRAQYRRLATLAGAAPKVTVHVLPFTAGPLAAGGAGGFSILQFGPPPAPGLVQLAGPGGGTCLHTPGAVTAYQTAFDRMREAALPARDSACWIAQLAGG